MISDKKALEVVAYAEKNGDSECLKMFPSLSMESLNRYRRKSNEILNPKKFPNILLFDIETLRMEGRFWHLGKQRINPDQVDKDWSIACWAAKWLGSSKTIGESVTPEEAIERQDKSILKGMWDLIDKADIIVAHNGERFDIRKLNWRWRQAGLMPPSPYLIVDTLKHSRRIFDISSHRLDYINKQRGLTTKMPTDISLWRRCEDGELAALKYMFKYCKVDIACLEDQYLDIRPWIKGHPNCGLFISGQDPVCPNCASTNLGYTTTDYYTPAGCFTGIRCKDCGGVGREMSNKFNKDSRKRLIRSIAR